MSRKLLVGTVVLSAAILAVVFSFHRSDPVYALSVSDFAAHPIYDREVRIQGTVVPGSVCYRADPCEYRFRLEDEGYSRTDAGLGAVSKQLSVRYPNCIVPDTFRPDTRVDMKVTVEGRQCASCHHFEASMLFAKVPGKYWMKTHDAAVEEPPKPVVPIPVCPKS